MLSQTPLPTATVKDGFWVFQQTPLALLLTELGELAVTRIVPGDELVFLVQQGRVVQVVVAVADVQITETDRHAGMQCRVGLLVKAGIEQIGDLGLLDVELHRRRCLGAANGAGGAAFVEAQQGVELIDRGDMHPEGIRTLLPDRTLTAPFCHQLCVAQAHQHQVSGGAGLLIAAKEGFDIGANGGGEVFELGAFAKVAEGEVYQQVIAAFVGDGIPLSNIGSLQDDLERSLDAAKCVL